MRFLSILASLAMMLPSVVLGGTILQVSSFEHIVDVGDIDDIDYRRETFDRYEDCMTCWEEKSGEVENACGDWCTTMKDLVQ